MPPTYPSVSKNVLLTGFQPFGGDKVNPSELVVKSMEGRLIAGRSIVTRVLPVETRTLRARLEEDIARSRPEFIILTGQAAGRTAVSLERVAINLLHFDQADNVGVKKNNDPIQKGGPEAVLSTLPLDKIVETWHENGIPASVSNSAGTFVCNQALYEALTLVASHAPPIPVGFVHLPFLPVQAIGRGSEHVPSMSLEVMKRAIEILLETVGPWLEKRPEENTRPEDNKQKPAANLWIPRGLKEAER